MQKKTTKDEITTLGIMASLKLDTSSPNLPASRLENGRTNPLDHQPLQVDALVEENMITLNQQSGSSFDDKHTNPASSIPYPIDHDDSPFHTEPSSPVEPQEENKPQLIQAEPMNPEVRDSVTMELDDT
jgi:hypothetical protein